MAERRPKLRYGLAWLGALSLIAAVAVTAVRPFWSGWLSTVQPNPMFGPFDASGAANDLTAGLLQTAVLSGVFWGLLATRTTGAWMPRLALVVTAIDIGLANGWMIATAPARLWHEPSKLASILDQDRFRPGGQPHRLSREPFWMPGSWRHASSPSRLAEAVRWDRDTLFPKYNLLADAAILEVHGALMPRDYREFVRLARMKDQRQDGSLPPPAEYAIHRRGSTVAGAREVEPRRVRAGLQDATLWFVPDRLPRAWIVHRVEVLPELAAAEPEQLRRRTREVYWPAGRLRDLYRSAVVEISSNSERVSAVPRGLDLDPAAELCRVIAYQPSRVEVEAHLERPGLVVLCDQFFPGWEVEVTTAGRGLRHVPILRTNRVMRGVWLEAGHHRLVYRYRPESFVWGAAVSAAAWTGLVVGSLVRLTRRGSQIRIH